MVTYQLPPGQQTDQGGVIKDAMMSVPNVATSPEWQAYQTWKAAGNAATPAAARVQYAGVQMVDAGIVTTDATAVEIYRFSVAQKRLHQGNLIIFGVDRGNFVSKAMEGRFTFKRTTAATAVVVGITVVSDIHDAAAAAWAPNCIASGADIVFTVQGAAGRTIDWRLTGQIVGYAPDGANV